MTRTLFISFLIISSLSYGQLIGNYTIGGVSPDYNTIGAAVTDLTAQGISGNVNFLIRNGVYDERVEIGYINGVGPSSSITFESEVGDTSGVTWRNTLTNAVSNYIVRCDSTQYLKFRNLTFANQGALGSTAIFLDSNCRNIEIETNHLKSHLVTSVSQYTNNSLVRSTHGISNVSIINNHFELGGYGIRLIGSAAQLDSNIFISDNIFTSIYGIFLNNIVDAKISSNIITSERTGISIYNIGNPVLIENNTIDSNEKGIYTTGALQNTGVIAPTIIRNNMVSANGGAMDISSGGTVMILNNSLLNRFYGNNSAALKVGALAIVQNNIIDNRKNYAAFWISTSNNSVISDYNLFYSAGSTKIFTNFGSYSSLTNWQNASGQQDQHSLYGASNYLGLSDLHIINNHLAYQKGISNSTLMDIDGELRDSPPCIGADEFVQPAHNIGMSSDYIGVDSVVCAGNHSFQAKLVNHGADTVYSAVINYSINGIIQTPIAWTGILPFEDSSAWINLTFNLPQDAVASIKVWSSLPNDSIDYYSNNDTLFLDIIKTRMQGVYFIGGVSSDYNTITDACDDLVLRGTCNNVTFSINDGNYNEQISLSFLNRHTLEDSLFFISTSGNTNGVIWASINQPNIELYAVRNVYFSNLSFQRNNSINSNSSPLLKITGPPTNINIPHRIKNFGIDSCAFISPQVNFASGVILSGGNVSVTNSLFKGMKKALQIHGSYAINAIAPIIDTNVIIQNNVFEDIWEKNIDLIDCHTVTINKNYIHNQYFNPNNSITNSAIAMIHCEGPLKITRNKINGTFNWPVNITNHLGDSVIKSKIENNFFSFLVGSNSATNFAAISAFVNNLDIHANSLNLAHSTSPFVSGEQPVLQEACIQTGGTNITILNNNINVDSCKVVFKYFSATLNTLIDYNNVNALLIKENYDNGTTNGPNHLNSVSIPPNFNSFEDLHLLNSDLAGLGSNIGPTIDIDSTMRSIPPSIGAAEWVFQAADILPTGIKAIVDCDSVHFYVDIKNRGTNNVDSFQLKYTIQNQLDSINYIEFISSGNTELDLYFASLPFINNTLYNISVQLILLDTTDLFPLNDFLNFDTTFNLTSPNPIIPITYSNGALFGNSFPVTWYFNNLIVSNLSASISNLQYGVYHYSFVTPSGCTLTSPNYTFSSIGLLENDLRPDFIYPNPTRNSFMISGIQGYQEVKIYSINGRLLENFEFSSNKEYNLEALPAGIYIVRVEKIGLTPRTFRIVKNSSD